MEMTTMFIHEFTVVLIWQSMDVGKVAKLKKQLQNRTGCYKTKSSLREFLKLKLLLMEHNNGPSYGCCIAVHKTQVQNLASPSIFLSNKWLISFFSICKEMRLYFFLVWLEFISTNTAKITHCTGVRVTANRNAWNYKFLMVKKNESLSERAFEVCTLVFPPLFLIHTPVKLIQIFCLLGLFWGGFLAGAVESSLKFLHIFATTPSKFILNPMEHCDTLPLESIFSNLSHRVKWKWW